MSSVEYHGTPGTHSSSQLKDCLGDDELFYKKHIAKEIEREEIGAFDVGTYFHTGVLEPHKLKEECIAYTGKIRRGAHWEAFKKKHDGKTIVTKVQISQAEKLVECVKNSPVAMGFIKKGKPEVSLFVELAVHGGEIFAPHRSWILTRNGWEFTTQKIPKDAIRIIVKVRADSLGSDFVLDLKSTTGNAKDEREMRNKISYYNYDLSASFYLDIFSIGVNSNMKKFLWTFASKDFHNTRTYVASDNNVLIGRAKWKKAILRIADGIRNKWTFSDILAVLEPNAYELEHIQQNEIDLV